MKAKQSWAKYFISIGLLIYGAVSLNSMPVSADAEEQVFIQDQYGERWKPGEMTSANIFNTINDPAVDSLIEEEGKLIAPGTSGSYSFTVYNSSSKSINYTLIGGNENKDEIPLDFKLRIVAGPWIKGQEGDWSLWSDTFPLNYQRTLAPGNHETIQLMWQWPFEQGKDREDTFFGERALHENLSYQLTLNVVAEEDTSEKSSKEEKTAQPSPKKWLQLPKTGESIKSAYVIAGIVILTFTIWRIHKGRRRKCD